MTRRAGSEGGPAAAPTGAGAARPPGPGTPPPARAFEPAPPRPDPVRRAARVARALDGANGALAARTRLGPWTLAPARHEHEEDRDFHFRSRPLRELDGARISAKLLARSVRGIDAERLVAHLAHVEGEAIPQLNAAGELVREAKATVARVLARRAGTTRRARIVDLAFRAGWSLREAGVVLDVESVGADLALGIDRFDVHPAVLEGKVEEALALHERRARVGAAAEAAGCVGWIDAAAELVLDDAGLTLAEGTRLLELRRTLRLIYRRGSGASLHWNDGVIRARFGVEASEVTYAHPTTWLPTTFPDTVIAALPGRRLGDLLEHPFLPADSRILEASTQHLHTMLVIEPRLRPIPPGDASAGPASADPRTRKEHRRISDPGLTGTTRGQVMRRAEVAEAAVRGRA